MNDKKQINFAGGCPAASYFLLLRQNKVAKEKATPVCRPSGTLDQPQKSGAAQLDLAGRTPRAPLRDSNITSDLAEVFFQPSRMASCFISARLNLRFLASDFRWRTGEEKPKIVNPYGGQQVAHHSQNKSAPVHWWLVLIAGMKGVAWGMSKRSQG